jgi:hypothetical protein
MQIESFALDLLKIIRSLEAPVYQEYWIPGEATKSGRPMKIQRKLDMHLTKKQALESAVRLQGLALSHAPGKYRGDTNNLGTCLGDALTRIKTIIEEGFPEPEYDQIKKLVDSRAFWKGSLS